MAAKRKIEIFSTGCPASEQIVQLINRVACPSCEVTVLDMHGPAVASRAKCLGVLTVPAVAINGKLAAYCAGGGPQEGAFHAAGIGQPI